jgi:hypothetical protein
MHRASTAFLPAAGLRWEWLVRRGAWAPSDISKAIFTTNSIQVLVLSRYTAQAAARGPSERLLIHSESKRS